MDLGSRSTRMVVVVGGGGNRRHQQQHHEAADRDSSPSSVDNQESVDDVASITSGVDPPELLPAHEIASEIAASEPVDDEDDDLANHHHNNNQRLDPDDEDPDPNNEDDEEETTVMIDTSDFRGLSEPTYQTLNGRMTPPGFPTSSSYATLTPLQPLPPISTMSDKFSHYGHHPGNGGFALMQNPSSLGMTSNYHHHHHQYDKLQQTMAAAGMNMGVSLGSGNVIIGSANHQSVVQHHAAAAAAMMNHSNGHNTHSQSNHGMSSPHYGHSNGLNSPDKSMSPTNGYDYSSGQRVLESPHSPSSVNLHSPTSLMPALNGMPSTPPSAQMPPSPSNDHKPIGLVSPHTHSPHVTYVTSSGQEVKVATSLATTPQHVTVLQTAVTPSQASAAQPAQTVTIVQANVSNHLTATIMSTPVAVVTTANVLQHQQQMQQQHQSNHTHVVNAKQATGGTKNCINSRSSDSSAASGDELEEINTKELAQRISAELKRYSIPQAIFAQRVLCRSQGTLSDLLRNPKPWSKLKSGRETFRRMSKWLEEPEFQRMSALRLAGQFSMLSDSIHFISHLLLLFSEMLLLFSSFCFILFLICFKSFTKVSFYFILFVISSFYFRSFQ